MQIYRYLADGDRFKRLGVIHTDQWKRIHALNGRSVSGHWKPFQVKMERRKASPDLLMLSGFPVFNSNAMSLIFSQLSEEAEALPIEVIGTPEPLYLIHPINILDCLDKDRSTYDRYEDGSEGIILKYKFKSNCVEDRLVFGIQETWIAETFVTERFRELVEQHKLLGLILNESTLLDEVDLNADTMPTIN
jgi:hypothetical protein